MTRRPPPTRRQAEAFIVAAHAARRTLHEIMRAAGLDFRIATDCLAHEVGAKRMAVRDEDRAHVWIEVLCIPSWAGAACRRAA